MDKIERKDDISIEQYLEAVALFCGSEYGKVIRSQFRDIRGASELAMLAAPTAEELAELRKGVAIMTPSEKQDAHKLTDDQMQRIAADARIDAGNFAIFMNGYGLQHKRTP